MSQTPDSTAGQARRPGPGNPRRAGSGNPRAAGSDDPRARPRPAPDHGPDHGPDHRPGDGSSGEVPPGRSDAMVAGAARVTDALMEVGEALVAALLGAVAGAGRTAAGIWAADRPRRQRERQWRRRRWMHRRGWWRVAVILELVSIGAWMGGRAAVRAARGVPGGAAQGARTGWDSGRGRAQDRRGTRRGTGPAPEWGTPGPAGPTASATSSPTWTTTSSTTAGPDEGEPIVDAEIVCTGCDAVLAPDDPGPLCPACRKARTADGGDDVRVTVQVTPTDPDPEPGSGSAGQGTAEPSKAEPSGSGTRRPDGRPETDYVRRFFAARAAGYRGPIGPEGYPVASLDNGARRLTQEEVAAAIAAGGYPPDGRPWPRFIRNGYAGMDWIAPVDGGDVVSGPEEPLLTPPASAAAEPTPLASTPEMSVGQPVDGPGPNGATPPGPINQHDHHEHVDQEDKSMTTSTTDMTITSGSGSDATVQGNAQLGGELTAVGDLRAELTVLRSYTETCGTWLAELGTWTAGLADQIAGAEWSTEAVVQAAVALAEARTVEEVRSGITALLSAVAEAQRLGEALAAGGARGQVSGLRPQ